MEMGLLSEIFSYTKNPDTLIYILGDIIYYNSFNLNSIDITK